MYEPVTPTSTRRAEAASSCCGTSEGAEAAGSCSDPQAEREAVATGAGCC